MISAIVLAAGLSRRMGKPNKLLLPLHGKPLVAHVCDHLGEAALEEIIVVLGHEADRVKEVLGERNVHYVWNSRYETGMTSSIQAGVEVLAPSSKGMMICLSDMPLITGHEYQILIDTFNAHLPIRPHLILTPVYHQKKGNPVIFSRYYRDAILSHPEPHGCQKLVRQHAANILECEMPTPHIFQDIDHPEEYQQMNS